ncbi:TPA: hypothetical protein ACGOSH_002297, partial [Streptococcus suis]
IAVLTIMVARFDFYFDKMVILTRLLFALRGTSTTFVLFFQLFYFFRQAKSITKKDLVQRS